MNDVLTNNKVIITDPFTRQALTVIRSLGRKGISVDCLYRKKDSQKYGLVKGAVSKYCSSLIISENLINDIINLSNKYSLLIPISTETIEEISKHLETIKQHINVPIPNHDVISRARNKAFLIKHCIKNKIPVPKTYFIKDLRELTNISHKINFPVIIKFRDEINIPLGKRYKIVYSEEALKREYKNMHKIQKFPLIQEYITGKGMGFFGLLNAKHEPRAIFCHERIREYPITGGQSTFCKSIYNEKAINYGIKLLKSLKWYGIAMVEFKLDEKDNTPKVMEVNPRFWGSLPLAVHSGVDFPYLLFKMALEGDIKPIMNYKVGVKMRYLFMDIKVLKEYIMSRRPNKFRFVLSFIKDLFDKDIRDGLISKDDPKPTNINTLLKEYFKKRSY